ncbi:hypothetical protein CR513_06759, partial [Mucuna pruriens]
MVLSRRPARFKKPDFMQPQPVSEEKMELLRAAAARVYIREQNSAQNSSEANTSNKKKKKVNTSKAGGCANVIEDADYDNGVELLAAVATGIGMEMEKEEEVGVGKKAS